MNNDLISRKWLTDAIRNRRTYLSYEDAKDVIDLINNAPTVENITIFCETADEETLEDIKKELQKVLDKLKERNNG